ncbi:MAG TPA: VOC family protein [Solirubrobacteraceae bacterium]|nr:VOC family protein [Solirubrobacteraceae bacterium]
MLPATLRLGAVELTVSDLDRSIAFYQQALGLLLHSREAGTATLGAEDEAVLMLVEQPEAAAAGQHAGIFHYALLYPSRVELARAGQRVYEAHAPVSGASDHGTHEAIYLSDPDGIGIELAADRPREAWPDVRSAEGYAAGPQPLDQQSLFGLLDGEHAPAQVEPGLRTGHLHLHVGDVERGLAFYRDVLGFELMVNLGTAAFVSAGGYHHHLGFNTWLGEGIGPTPPDTIGLRHWTVLLENEQELEAVRERLRAAGILIEPRERGFRVEDPWRIAVAFETPA